MKSRVLILIFVCVFYTCYPQKYSHYYEMSIQESTSGFYYVEYIKKDKKESAKLQISIMDVYQNAIKFKEILVISNGDSVIYETDESGNIYINRDSIKIPMCVYINNYGTRRSDFSKCIYFWDWDNKQTPTKLVIVLGEKERSVFHINSDIPLEAEDIMTIKNCILKEEYNNKLFKHIKIRRLIYI